MKQKKDLLKREIWVFFPKFYICKFFFTLNSWTLRYYEPWLFPPIHVYINTNNIPFRCLFSTLISSYSIRIYFLLIIVSFLLPNTALSYINKKKPTKQRVTTKNIEKTVFAVIVLQFNESNEYSCDFHLDGNVHIYM